MDFLFHAHSGLRYLVLLAGIIAIIAFAYGLISRKPLGSARALTAAFVGLLDLQVLLGIVLLLVWPFYGALIGHITLMVVAAAVAHIASVRARRAPDERKALTIRLGGVVVALLVIALGITAIGRSIV